MDRRWAAAAKDDESPLKKGWLSLSHVDSFSMDYSPTHTTPHTLNTGADHFQNSFVSRGEFVLLLYSIFRMYLREELFQLTNEQQTNSVVFMTFWQGIALSLLATTTDIIGSDDDDDDQVDKYAKQAQNFLICLEMLGFSIAHFYCFPVEEWEEGYEPEEDRKKYGDKMALGDFLQDLKVILR